MCGIVGYTGNENAVSVVLEGLSKLEYRGYDSAGIAVGRNGKTECIKAVGKLENLKNEIKKTAFSPSCTGIGHTRWATHGKPTVSNAHPHSGENFTLVHNGIIENYEELKEKYLSGVHFNSTTDSEVIAKLLDKLYESEKDIKKVICRLMELLSGSYALAIIFKEEPDKIYAVKNKSPLLIGKGDGFGIIASDASAMISRTNLFCELKNKEFAVITKNKTEMYSIDLAPINRDFYTINYELSDTEKGIYPHYMLKEIEEQPSVIRKIVSEYRSEENGFNFDKKLLAELNACEKIYIIACGTSYHAGLLGKEFFEKISKKPAEALIASEFSTNPPLLCEKAFFIFVSQSGETADCISVAEKLDRSKHKTLCITNVKNSSLSRSSDFTLELFAGPEIAVASTKAYTAQVSLLAVLASAVKNTVNIDVFKELRHISNAAEEICGQKELFKNLSEEFLKNSSDCFYIGRSTDYFACLEAALKLKEISYIHTEGFAAGELKHGTIALIENNTPVIAIITQQNIAAQIRSNIKEVCARGAGVITICTESLKSSDDQIIIGDVCELLSPILSIIPAQYLAYYSALLKGCDIDKPRNLAKSVTVE